MVRAFLREQLHHVLAGTAAARRGGSPTACVDGKLR